MTGILVSDGYGVYCQWVHARQTCLAHLIRRARGLAEPSAKFTRGGQGAVAADRLERKVVLFSSPWELQYFERQYPDVTLLAESPPIVS